MDFKPISPQEITDNLFTRIGTDWMLITAGTPEDCNTMTASWGQAGILWNKPVATVYVRPQRHTRRYIDPAGRFSLSFFTPGTRRQELNLLGTKSGRDGNKIAEAGLHVQPFGADKTPALAEASMVVVCRKLYQQDLAGECFTDSQPDKLNYPEKDYHRMYVGEIEAVFAR